MKKLLKISLYTFFALKLCNFSANAQEQTFKSDSLFKNFDEVLCENVENSQTYNTDSLLKNTVFPDIFKKSSFEGVAYVSVLVDTNGNALKTKIVKSTHELINEPSINTVLKLRFTPAMHKGRKIACWLIVPVEYKLR
jgi:hypothetical protein